MDNRIFSQGDWKLRKSLLTSEKWVYGRIRKDQEMDLAHGNLPPYMEKKFYPQNVQMEKWKEKEGLCLAKNHNFRCAIHLVWEECQCYLFFTKRKISNKALQPNIESSCFEKMERRPQACLGKVIIPLPFNYNYHTKNSCIVLHSFIVVQLPVYGMWK